MTPGDTDEQPTVPTAGDVITHERTFSVEAVREFGKITGDQQAIHTELDDDGRLVVQGLLTGSLMTKIGGDLNYIARTMEYEFLQPVYTGESITCEWTVESRTDRDDRYLLDNVVVYRNEVGDTVADARTAGLIWKSDSE